MEFRKALAPMGISGDQQAAGVNDEVAGMQRMKIDIFQEHGIDTGMGAIDVEIDQRAWPFTVEPWVASH
jgi:hypothetical protein